MNPTAPQSLSYEQRREMRELEAKATPGPWVSTPADLDFIAAARTFVPAALDQIDRLQAELAAEQRRRDDLQNCVDWAINSGMIGGETHPFKLCRCAGCAFRRIAAMKAEEGR